MREILFYRTTNGSCPVEDFLDGLRPKHAQKVVWVLQLVKELPFVPCQYLKKLESTDGIWEVRSRLNNRIARTLFAVVDEEIVLLHGFIKKQQKTPQEELDLAKKRKKQYLHNYEK